MKKGDVVRYREFPEGPSGVIEQMPRPIRSNGSGRCQVYWGTAYSRRIVTNHPQKDLMVVETAAQHKKRRAEEDKRFVVG